MYIYIQNPTPPSSPPRPHALRLPPPPAVLLERIEKAGFPVMHAYGKTEAMGPALVCEWRVAWDAMPATDRARRKAG